MCLSIGNFYLKSLNRPIRHHPFKYINNPPGLHQKNSSAFSLLYPSYKPRATVKWQLFFFFFFEVFQIVTYLIRICSGFLHCYVAVVDFCRLHTSQCTQSRRYPHRRIRNECVTADYKIQQQR